jgi:hypothetical protein
LRKLPKIPENCDTLVLTGKAGEEEKETEMNKTVNAEAIEELRQVMVRTSDAIISSKSDRERNYWVGVRAGYQVEIADKHGLEVDELIAAWTTWTVRNAVA